MQTCRLVRSERPSTQDPRLTAPYVPAQVAADIYLVAPQEVDGLVDLPPHLHIYASSVNGRLRVRISRTSSRCSRVSSSQGILPVQKACVPVHRLRRSLNAQLPRTVLRRERQTDPELFCGFHEGTLVAAWVKISGVDIEITRQVPGYEAVLAALLSRAMKVGFSLFACTFLDPHRSSWGSGCH